MAAAERRAEIYWEGRLEQGDGSFALGDWMVGEPPVSWRERIGPEGNNASPEELMAAAQASCFSMALSSVLEDMRKTPEEMGVSTSCILDETDEGFKITAMNVEVRGQIPGMSPEEFSSAVGRADQICPVTNALRGNVDIRVSSVLEDGV
ncbi:MAG: OsmC family peroxiredoxin [Rubrobacteraceae bacterium]